MKNKTKCKHFKGKGHTYEIFDGEISLCNKCDKLLRKGMTEKIEFENTLILPVIGNKNGQRRITIPSNSKIDTKYVEVRKHE